MFCLAISLQVLVLEASQEHKREQGLEIKTVQNTVTVPLGFGSNISFQPGCFDLQQVTWRPRFSIKKGFPGHFLKFSSTWKGAKKKPGKRSGLKGKAFPEEPGKKAKVAKENPSKKKQKPGARGWKMNPVQGNQQNNQG